MECNKPSSCKYKLHGSNPMLGENKCIYSIHVYIIIIVLWSQRKGNRLQIEIGEMKNHIGASPRISLIWFKLNSIRCVSMKLALTTN